MPYVDDETAREYREAWEGWRKQIDHVNRVFLDGEAIRPEQMKGLLNREARWKQRFDDARLRLLGLDRDSPLAGPENDNPFR